MTLKDKVYKLMWDMKDPFSITDNVKPENRNDFISIVKESIRFNMFNDFIIEFNNDYTKIRKISK